MAGLVGEFDKLRVDGCGASRERLALQICRENLNNEGENRWIRDEIFPKQIRRFQKTPVLPKGGISENSGSFSPIGH